MERKYLGHKIIFSFKYNRRYNNFSWDIKITFLTLNHFSEVTDLRAKMGKSNIFMTGINDFTMKVLIEKIEFVVGILSIRYLGFALSSSNKWNKLNHHQLVL